MLEAPACRKRQAFCQAYGSMPINKTKTGSFGDIGEEGTPGSIPNPEAKLFSADGTALEAEWESRSLPTEPVFDF